MPKTLNKNDPRFIIGQKKNMMLLEIGIQPN